MRYFWRKFHRSIVTNTLITVATRITLVIMLLTTASYLHIFLQIETTKLEEFQSYTVERAARESQLFELAEDNHQLLKKQLINAYLHLDKNQQISLFDQEFQLYPDGAIRNQSEHFDGTKTAGFWMAAGVALTPDIKFRAVLFNQMASQYGQSWQNRFINTYLMAPENFASNYWPDIPDFMFRLAADFDIRQQEYFQMSSPEFDPEQATVWTGVYQDQQAGIWMVSAGTPVYFQQRHIATIGNDMALDELIARTIAIAPKGGYNLIFRADGRLIADAHYIEQLKASDGDFFIDRDGGDDLKAIYQSVLGMAENETVLESDALDAYLMVSTITGPNWYYVSVIPRATISRLAASTAAIVFLMGLIALMIVLFVLSAVMRQKITLPLTQLTRATLALARGHEAKMLDSKRTDELGRLARSFNTMSLNLVKRDAQLVHSAQVLETQLLQLRHSQQRLDHAQGVAQLGSWDYDVQANRLSLSNELVKLLAIAPNDIMGLTLDDLFQLLNPSEDPQLQQAFQSFLTNGGAFNRSHTLSDDVFVHITGLAERNAAGEIVSFSGTVQDLTEQYKTQQAMYESEQLFRNAFHHSPISMAIVALDGRILQANDNLCKTFGYTKDEIHQLEFVTLVHPQEREVSMSRLASIVRGESKSYDAERILMRKDGTKLWCFLKVFVQMDRQGKPDYSFIQCMDITQQKQAENKLNYQAFYDQLTRLANRTLFIEFLNKAIGHYHREPKRQFALLFLDLDGFKLVNDSLGHLEGDNLLIAITERLQSEIRETDVLARFGGDEFCILLNDISDESQATELARRINRVLSEPFDLNGELVNTNASIGIILANSNLDSAQEYLRDADSAMYHAKQEGRGRYAIFNTDMHQLAKSQLRLRNELKLALQLKQFVPFYQPIINVASGSICGFEVLVRWQHPERGLLAPSDFLNVAEDMHLIAEIDYQIIEMAMVQLVALRQQTQADYLTISCNASSELISTYRVVDRIKALLIQYALPATCLNIEVTETVLVKNPETTRTILNQLKRLGISIHLDDFGTGYSSLSYLHQFPIHNIKIDRSFIARMLVSEKDSAIVESIVILAKRLGITVTAEGVESETQFDALQAMGITYTQGYYHDKPLEAAALFDAVAPLVTSLKTGWQ